MKRVTVGTVVQYYIIQRMPSGCTNEFFFLTEISSRRQTMPSKITLIHTEEISENFVFKFR